MVDPEARSSEKEHGQAKKEGAVGSIRGLVSDNIPALRPEHRAFVVVNGVLAILLLGVLLFSADAATAKWATAGTLALFALNSILVFLLSRGRQRTRQTGDYERRRQAAESVNGDWWQIILVSGEHGDILVEGLTIVNIRLYVAIGSYGLDGEFFDEKGKSRAQWRAEAVAIKALTPLELFYRFAGYTFRSPTLSDPSGDVTGIGVFTFEASGDGEASVRGSGWFATGHLEKLEFGKRRDVRLVRVTESEKEALDGKGIGTDSSVREQLIEERYRILANRYGTVTGSRWD
jgi:hypothetical protein